MIESESMLIDNETPMRATVRIEQDGKPLFAMTLVRSSEQSDGDVARAALATYLGARFREHSHALHVTKVDGVGRCDIGDVIYTARVSA